VFTAETTDVGGFLYIGELGWNFLWFWYL